MYGERKGSYRVLVGIHDERRQLGRHKRRWERILKWVFMKWDGGMDWIDMAPGRDRWRALVCAIINLRVS